jgi:hypothetical protein
VRVDPFIEAVRAKLQSRSQAGLIKYGVGLDRDDLDRRAWLVHLQEELLDAAAYIERLLSYEDVKPCICPRDCDCEDFAAGLVSQECPTPNP